MNLEKILQEVFGYTTFKEGQKECIQALFSQQDVLCILPTGTGKSLIYQLPSAISESGITLVISPLVALMKEQSENLKILGIQAEYCYSEQDELEQKAILSRAVMEKLKVLFLSPERASSPFFRSLFLKMKINFLVVDEAHCISEWGHDFRPEYRKIHELREIAKTKFPILALTATATSKVKEDILSSLKMQNVFIYQTSFFRKNLKFQVRYINSKEEKQKHLLQIIQNTDLDKKVLIYCATRKETQEVERFLKNNQIPALSYHAGKTTEERKNIQNDFTNNKVLVLVTTNAFGLGINVANIQIVVHYSTPASIEAYYQETGRSGRNGNLGTCILFWYAKDFELQKRIRYKNKNLHLIEDIKRYALTWECRQVFLCKYFGEDIESCGTCDVCTDQNKDEFLNYCREIKTRKKESRIAALNEDELDTIIKCIEQFSGKFGKKMLISTLRGSRTKQILKKRLDHSIFYGKLSHLNEASVNSAIETLILEKKIFIKGKKYPKLTINKLDSKEKKNIKNLFLDLKNYRDKIAKKYGYKKFMVLQNSVLERIAETKPVSLEELLCIKGIGKEKASRYGREILQIIQKYNYNK